MSQLLFRSRLTPVLLLKIVVYERVHCFHYAEGKPSMRSTSEGGKPFIPGFSELPEAVRRGLFEIAVKYDRKGVEVFLFGSFARGDNRRTSDIDLGVTWKGEPSRELFTQLWEDVQRLPTIRKVDLVDMDTASPELRRMAQMEKRSLLRDG